MEKNYEINQLKNLPGNFESISKLDFTNGRYFTLMSLAYSFVFSITSVFSEVSSIITSEPK